MKILKYLLYLIIALIILFFAFGIFKPSVSYGHEITVNKPIKEAWAVSQDESKLGLWLEGFKSIELISGEAGEVGSKYKVVVNPGDGQPDFEMIETFVAKKEFESRQLSFDSDMMLFDQTTTYSESDGKTTIKTNSKVKGKGIVMRSMFAILETFGGMFQSQEEKNVEALKEVIEANMTDYYPVQVVEMEVEES